MPTSSRQQRLCSSFRLPNGWKPEPRRPFEREDVDLDEAARDWRWRPS